MKTKNDNVMRFRKPETWLRERQKRLGASESPAVLGVGYAEQTPMSVYADKKCNPPTVTDEEQKRFDLGNIGEEFVLKVFEHETGRAVNRERFIVRVSPEVDWMAASCDGLTVDNGEPVEAKLVMHQKHEWADGQAP